MGTPFSSFSGFRLAVESAVPGSSCDLNTGGRTPRLKEAEVAL